jgi:alkanesulfonate monooxygenase SsuD/methylene tetrahydromethanopterin reductase-like flavin-dependent oxidoreductase (luciferase family)
VTYPRLAARFMIERAAAARRAGLDLLFLGDHHATLAPYYQNTPMLGRLLAEWGDAPAGCLFLLPLWNPVLVAEQIGTLAAIARGRFIMQCGLGYGEEQFVAMGTTMKTRVSAFEQALDIVRRLLAGETVSASGRFGSAPRGSLHEAYGRVKITTSSRGRRCGRSRRARQVSRRSPSSSTRGAPSRTTRRTAPRRTACRTPPLRAYRRS